MLYLVASENAEYASGKFNIRIWPWKYANYYTACRESWLEENQLYMPFFGRHSCGGTFAIACTF